MTDPFKDPAFEKQVRAEFARIGIQGGVNIGGPFTPEQLLEGLRLIPDGGGGQALLAKIAEVVGRSSRQ